jgi:hypothetical protein
MRENLVATKVCEKHPLLAGVAKQGRHDRMEVHSCTEGELAASFHAALRVISECRRFC